MPATRKTRRPPANDDDLVVVPRFGGVSPRRPVKPAAVGTSGASGTGTFGDFAYQGGPVIHAPEVHILFVGDWTSTANQNRATRLTQFVTDLLSSRYMNILSQYGCGTSGTVGGTAFVAAPDSSLSTADIHTLIQTAIDKNEVPEPTAQLTCVLLYMDDATAVEDTETGVVMCEASSDNAFGYHYHFLTKAGNACPFAVVPGLTDGCLTNSCPGNDQGCSLHLAQTQEQRQTQVSSHELSEMFSNPQVNVDEGWSRPGNPHENGDICNGLSGTITVGANTWTVQKMYSKWHDMATNGTTTCILECDPLPSLLPACTIILDRSTFGRGEVEALLAVSDPAHVEAAFYVAVDGFTPADLKITASSLVGVPNVTPNLSFSPSVAGVSFEATSLVPDDPSLSGAIQRFTWIYRASFTSSGGFPALPGQTSPIDLSASVSRASAPNVSATGLATIELTHEPNPYEVDGPVSWLSTDLRVFQIPAGDSKFNATMGAAAPDAPDFIQQVIANLNSGDTGGQTFEADLSTDENVSHLELSETVNGTPIFNFALAKVRYRSLSEDVSNVRVFFRLFQTSTTGTVYDQSAYPRGGQGGTVISLLGTTGGEIATIPMFAAPRIDTATQSMNAQTDSANVRTIEHDASGTERIAYFGAWLDINQPSQPMFPLVPSPPAGPFTGGGLQTIQQLIRGVHQCLVAEIAFDPDPIATGSTPGSSDKLAQRNLSIVASANPGTRASRIIPNTFELVCRPVPEGGASNELLIDFAALPPGSSATIYLPGVSAAAIKRAADERYASHHLKVLGGATLECPAQGLVYVPAPTGLGRGLAGLLTVALPEGIRHGEAFKVIVRELADARSERVPEIQARSSRGRLAGANKRRPGIARWRRVVGSFQVSIPVQTSDTMLHPEERLLAVLRWILESVPSSNRWYRVFDRYVELVTERVQALGGDPYEIEPSPRDEPPKTHGGHRRLTGKVSEVAFDCFGELESFALTDCRERHQIVCREQRVGELVLRAARERLTLTVWLRDGKGSAIQRIVVLA